MKEKRSLFQIIFGAIKQKVGLTQLQILSGYTPVFTSWGDDPYKSPATREAVDAIARNAAKLKAKHIRRSGPDIIHVIDQMEYILQVRPNPNMNAYDFLYKMVTTLMLENNAFAYPVWDPVSGNLTALWPVNCSLAEFLEDDSGTIYTRFYFGIGKQVILPYSEVLHLRRHFYKNELLGEDNKPINETLSAVHTANEGIGQAIKTSANLRGIIKFQGMLKEEDIKKNRERFMAEYMTVSNNGGIAALDSKAEYTELKGEPKILNAPQMKELRDSVYRYFGVNENIVKGDYTEDQWNAFYESTIEPIAVQMSLEFTSKLFTPREQGFGNMVVFEANRLQYASVSSKISMVQNLMPMGLFSINEMREIFNMGPVEGGEKRIISLNYVSADIADLYQIGDKLYGGQQPAAGAAAGNNQQTGGD